MIVQLQNIVLDDNKRDQIAWKSRNGRLGKFKVQSAYFDLQDENTEVKWWKLVWFSQNIPKHSFVLWMAILNKLNTQDKVRSWGSYDLMVCPLCYSDMDSHSHLFFKCGYAKKFWEKMLLKMGSKCNTLEWNGLINEFASQSNGNTIGSIIRRLCLAISVYLIWQERNCRIFRNECKEWEDLFNMGCEIVKLRLLSLTRKPSKEVFKAQADWEISYDLYRTLEHHKSVRMRVVTQTHSYTHSLSLYIFQFFFCHIFHSSGVPTSQLLCITIVIHYVLCPNDHHMAATHIIGWRKVAAKNVHLLLAQKVSKEIGFHLPKVNLGVGKSNHILSASCMMVSTRDLTYLTCEGATLGPRSDVLKNWCLLNISLSVFGANASVSICSVRNASFFSSIFSILKKHNLDVRSASIHSDYAKTMCLMNLRVNAPIEIAHIFPYEDVFKITIDDINYAYRQRLEAPELDNIMRFFAYVSLGF
ncbi:reverse transcriptase zinc-binding domain-containing protein [Artemisia annua]|uniref:Reverse transcriptase zinc-binding domain-containing protein n=1 Tax=Artemisia annua TaxID=35608 RepID=A0A2U1LUT3_ARTAN|nr:reverse transcriptase zinc-binding domain-containing protein [Artemisia annua]